MFFFFGKFLLQRAKVASCCFPSVLSLQYVRVTSIKYVSIDEKSERRLTAMVIKICGALYLFGQSEGKTEYRAMIKLVGFRSRNVRR